MKVYHLKASEVFGRIVDFDDVHLLPNHSTIPSRSVIDVSVELVKGLVLRIPVISANMDTVTEYAMARLMWELGGLGIIHRFLSVKKQQEIVARIREEGGVVGAAIGIRDYQERAGALVDAGANILVVDVAHGHTDPVAKVVKCLKTEYEVPVMAGNVCTREGVEFLREAGADVAKVGIGNGLACTTRKVAGVGLPQLTTIIECSGLGVPIVSDGGIRRSGDVVKALAAGGNAVMVGSLLAGTDESPGETIIGSDGIEYKVYRGMASYNAIIRRRMLENNPPDFNNIIPEGAELLLPYKGGAKDVVTQLVGGLKSGMSYLGAWNIPQLVENARFVISR